MKSEKTKQKALQLYISNLPMERISKQLKVSVPTLNKWKRQYKWIEQREKTLQKVLEKLPEKNSQIITDQIEVTELVDKELLHRLRNQEGIRARIQELLSYAKQLNPKKDKDEYWTTIDCVKNLSVELFQNKDLITWGKHGLDIVRPKTNTEVNLLKQEINKGLVYKFEVENARSKDKVISETT